ncbi:MAG: hypothetical protein J6C43_02870 [Oscillospiraceae bacterium]|nr:hypothetical protein [Oscillospiraceae bacterium]MBP3519987.1 hypothetical protein [Oscillospiraceae bacterium]
MTIEIEYFKGDTWLYGEKVSFDELKQQIKTVESLYDPNEDNFVVLLCRMYHWSIADCDQRAEYIYDRDTEKWIKVRFE